MMKQQPIIIKEFKKYLQQLGYGKGTIYMLPDCVKDFLEYHNITEVKEINQEHIKAFYEWLQIRPHKLKEGGLSDIYIHHHIYALKVFLNWLEETGQIKYNPISAMKFKRPKSNSREPLEQAEITKLFEAANTLKEKGLLHIFYSCGLRRAEAEALNINDIHFKQQLLYVREGKGAKRRAIPMTKRVTEELENYYLNERTQVKAHHDQEAFMLNRTGSRMSGNSHNREVKAIIQRAGIAKEATLHHLRHSIATHLLESGLKIEYVKEFLGHSNLEATQIYAKVNKYQLKKL
jgi:integrase/recombinase XerD